MQIVARFILAGIIFAIVFTLGGNVNAQNPSLNNAWRIFADSTLGEAAATQVHLDGQGNMFIAGFLEGGEIDFDFGAGISGLATGSIYEAQYFAKYTTNGNLLWARKIGGQNLGLLNAMEIGTNGEVYLAGEFESYLGNEPDFDPGLSVVNLPFAGSRDGFIAKYDANGDFIWASRVGGGSVEHIRSAALDDDGNLYITGYFSSNVTFAPGITLSTSPFFGDPFVAKYSSSTGTCLWAKRIASTGVATADEAGQAISVFGNSVYVAGEFNGTIDLDPGAGILSQSSNGGRDIFVLKLDTAGVFQTGFAIGSANLDQVSDIDVDGIGNVYLLASQIGGSVDFDPGAGATSMQMGSAVNSVIAKYDSQLQFRWARQVDGGENRLNDLDVIQDGTVFCTGHSQDTIDIDGGVGVSQLISPVENGLVCSYDSAGGFRFGFQLETSNVSKGIGICADSSCKMAVVGSFKSVVDMAPSPASFGLVTPFAGDCGFLGVYDWKSCSILSELRFPFTAELTPRESVALNWELNQEGNWLFDVEKSTNGQFWTMLGSQANTSSRSAEDHDPFIGTTYYRVIAKDLSGNKLTSEVVLVQNNSEDSPVRFSNPVTNILKISVPKTWLNARFYLLDISGQVVRDGSISEEIIEIDVSRLASGRYFIRFPERYRTIIFLKN